MNRKEKLIKIATRAAMTFMAHGRRKTHCGPGSEFDEFFCHGNYAPENYTITLRKLNSNAILAPFIMQMKFGSPR